ncbi:MAG TPA: formyl transferase [Alphaproteobacteria bacterium]|nr:formyl transferase [Alphaproteobacteria bacterium]
MLPQNNPLAENRIVVLTTGSGLANMLVNKLAAHFGPLTVIQEAGEDASTIFRRRKKMLGWWNAMGQHLFTYYGLRIVGRLSRRRMHAIWAAHGLESDLKPGNAVHKVPSVNSPECRALLTALNPKVVAVYGTRIIKKDTLHAIEAPFINYHAGMNPKYRGQSGAYWALRNGDQAHAGLTIHLVDEGVDTGSVIFSERSEFDRSDTFPTYHFVQMAQAAPLMIRAIEDALGGRLKTIKPNLPSSQYFMPTLWGYAWAGLTKGVW